MSVRQQAGGRERIRRASEGSRVRERVAVHHGEEPPAGAGQQQLLQPLAQLLGDAGQLQPATQHTLTARLSIRTGNTWDSFFLFFFLKYLFVNVTGKRVGAEGRAPSRSIQPVEEGLAGLQEVV